MQFLRSIYLKNLLFTLLGINTFIFINAFFFPSLLFPAKLIFALILVLFIVDILSIFRIKKGILAERNVPDRLSNGDSNDVFIKVENHYPFSVQLQIIDELPIQFQIRNFFIRETILAGAEKIFKYQVKPLKRGEYVFGGLNVYVRGVIGFISRRYIFDQDKAVAVYPSFLQMRKYELHAISNNLTQLGIKKIRKLGNNREFDHIKEYVTGDDIRTINWKATARKGSFMVNRFQDEKAQNVYCVIDKGRTMKMPFDGMTLLDYAINATLVTSNVALTKDDKAGLIIYNNKLSSFVPAEKKPGHLNTILQVLYKEKTAYLESNNEILYLNLKKKVSQRSLILLFTNFESLSSMKRQLPYLRLIAAEHLLVTIFFQNTELKHLLNKKAVSTEDIYLKTIAEKFAFEKKLIVKELQKYGILSILTTPESMTVDTLNKYLEIKSRNLI
jgi:uncharacterized protein (DUF58 family)